MWAHPWLLSAAIVAALSACQPAGQGTAPLADSAAPPAMTDDPFEERSHAFQCDGVPVHATYRGQDSATVVAAGKTYVMASQPAASGARYGDGQGNEFWTKGADEGQLTLAGEPERNCSAVAARDAATENTVGFQASGHAPAWTSQVAAGPAPNLHIVMDDGERTLDITTLAQGRDGWAGRTDDGTQVRLVFQRTVCQDAVSGLAHGATAMLTVGARQYHGCGDFADAPALASQP